MSDSQIAKIIMATNNLSNARSLLNEAINEGGDIAAKISTLINILKDCENELHSIQANA
ncbi:MAG: hypothetical protein GXY86_08970 [Firmicutes bacterium]|nr:hypothetical protein [Bacillota bacterium]